MRRERGALAGSDCLLPLVGGLVLVLVLILPRLSVCLSIVIFCVSHFTCLLVESLLLLALLRLFPWVRATPRRARGRGERQGGVRGGGGDAAAGAEAGRGDPPRGKIHVGNLTSFAPAVSAQTRCRHQTIPARNLSLSGHALRSKVQADSSRYSCSRISKIPP